MSDVEIPMDLALLAWNPNGIDCDCRVCAYIRGIVRDPDALGEEPEE